MNLKVLDGSEIKIDLSSTSIYQKSGLLSNQFIRSRLQKTIGDRLLHLYPNNIIFTEVFIPKEHFFLDFFIPSLNIVIEVNGKQHHSHVRYFHKTISDFNNQKERDERKRQWCELNSLKFIEVNDD